jgi:polysaccharide deacetylase 2 family uncharacterized protein YibQ
MTKKKTTPKKKSPARKKKRQTSGMSQGMRILLASLFLIVFVAVCIVVLVGLRAKLETENAAFVYEEPKEVVATPVKALTYADILQLVDTQLINGPDSMGWKRLPMRDGVDVRTVFAAFPSKEFLAELDQHIRQTGTSAQLKVSHDKGLIHLYWNGHVKMELLYERPQTKTVPPDVKSQPKIAIIMDDIGGSFSAAKGLVSLSLPVTPSILPGTTNATKAAKLFQQHQLEYMIHIPMEPVSYPKTSPGENALLVDLPEAEIRARMRSYIDELPGAIGGNNHMGSRYTEEVEPMRIVLDEMKAHNLFFIDSRTIGNSVAFSEARKMGLKTATRNIFLDNKSDVEYIREQLRKMVRLAGNGREIIAICHPHQETFDALRLEASWLKQQSVSFVTASKLVHSY